MRYFWTFSLLAISMAACTIKQSNDISMQATTATESVDESLSSTSDDTSETQCPPEDSDLRPWFPICEENGDCRGGPYYEDVLRYFNMGGTLKNLEGNFGGNGHFIDLTGDGIEEYAWRDAYAVFVFGCKNSQYEIVLEVLPIENGPDIEFIDDLNGNGIPELFISFYGRYYIHSLRILEWNGSDFISLIKISGDDFSTDALVTMGWEYYIQDTNQDQLQEIIVINSSPIRPGHNEDNLFDRKETITLEWDGHNYIVINGDD